MTVPKKSQL